MCPSPALPLDSSNGAITIGDGTRDGRSFLMQMTSGSSAYSVTHRAPMMPINP